MNERTPATHSLGSSRWSREVDVKITYRRIVNRRSTTDSSSRLSTTSASTISASASYARTDSSLNLSSSGTSITRNDAAPPLRG